MDKCNNSYFHISFVVLHVACCSPHRTAFMWKFFFHFLQFISSSPTFFVNCGKKYRERKIFSCKFLAFDCVSEEVEAVLVRISPQSKEKFFFPFLFMCVLEHASIFMVHASVFSSYFVKNSQKKLFGYLNSLLSLPPSIHPKWGSNIENGQVRKKTRGNWISFFYIQSLSVHYVYPSSFKSWKIWIHKSATSSTLLLILNGSSIERDSEKIILLLSFP